MRLVLTAMILAATATFGAIKRSPAGCTSRPCTYTLTCVSAVCTSTESAELQTVLDEAHLGDTIRLQAGRIWTGTSSNFRIQGRPGSGWLTITTTMADRLPLPGTRITPHYRGVMPTIRNCATCVNALRFPPSNNPARNIRIVGVRFDTQGNNAPLIQIGYNTTEPWNQDPTDIVIDRCIVENSGWLTSAGSLIGYRGHRVSILNSYIQGSIKQPGAEVQNIGRVWGECNILNNYIAENMGENIMLGGTDPDVDIEPWNHSSGEIAYNVLINHRERVPHLAWKPNTRYFKSVMVRYNGVDYRATNSGTSGATFTEYDNGIQWVQVSGTPSSKNIFEIKNAKNLKIHHNTFEGFWTKAQYQIIVFKVSNSSTPPVNCAPQFAGNVNVSGDVVTSTTGSVIPDLWWGTGENQNAACRINIDGSEYTIKNFDLGNPQRIVLTTTAGQMLNVPYTYGHSNCKGAYLQNISLEHNVIRSGPQALQILSLNNARFSRVGNIRVRNNLIYDIDRNQYCMAGADCAMSRAAFYFSQIPFGVDFSNNTVLDVKNMVGTVMWEGHYSCRGWCASQAPCSSAGGMPTAGDTRFANNILHKSASNMFLGFTPSVNDAAMVAAKICEGGCTKEKWDGNILAGVSLGGYPSGTYNLCPFASACGVDFEYNDLVYGRLFEDYREKNWKVRSGHYAQKGGMYGRQMGADWESLPIVTKISTGGIGVDITVSETAIRLDYQVTAPIRQIPCVVEASTTPDIEGGRIADLDAAMHLRPDVDGPPNGIRRSVTIGTRTPLERGRTYFLRLHCGGAYWEGEVTTR